VSHGQCVRVGSFGAP